MAKSLTAHEAWARAIAAGIPDDVFRRSTPREIAMVFRAINDRERTRERRANFRAGVIASILINIYSRKGAPVARPTDFFREREPDHYMTVEEAKQFALSLARRR